MPDPALDGRPDAAEEVSRARRGTSAEGAAPAAVDPAERAPRLTFRRLSGLDRSGPPPPQTRAGSRCGRGRSRTRSATCALALIPVFLVVALSDGGGPSVLAAVLLLRSPAGATTPTGSPRA